MEWTDFLPQKVYPFTIMTLNVGEGGVGRRYWLTFSAGASYKFMYKRGKVCSRRGLLISKLSRCQVDSLF